jgi:hypothetical protein
MTISNDTYFPLIKTNLILSTFSMIGCLTIILLYCFRSKLRSFIFSLVFFLSISELINSLANLFSIDKLYITEDDDMQLGPSYICEIQSILLVYTDFCTLTWVLIISYSINELMCNFNQDIVAQKRKFIIFGYSFPLIFTLT